jgi:serine/threonine-protein kinase RsbW
MAGKTKRKEFSLDFPSQVEYIEQVEALTEKACNYAKFSEDERDSMAIAVTEAVNNAILHGNKKNLDKAVHVTITATSDTVRVVILDEGDGFNPQKIDNPLEPQNLLKESGRGVFIVRSLMDQVSFDFSKGGTEITLVKTRKAPGA